MNLNNIIYHDLTYTKDLTELQCCDSQNPRVNVVIDPAEVGIYRTLPGSDNELMAHYKDKIWEINFCEGCYENIIITLMKQVAAIPCTCNEKLCVDMECKHACPRCFYLEK
jgi:hypothetical protein